MPRSACSARQFVAATPSCVRKASRWLRSRATCATSLRFGSWVGVRAQNRSIRACNPATRSASAASSSPASRTDSASSRIRAAHADLGLAGDGVAEQLAAAAQQMRQTRLMRRTGELAARRPPVTLDHPGEPFAQDALGVAVAATAGDVIPRHLLADIGPQPVAVAVDPPARLVRGDRRRVPRPPMSLFGDHRRQVPVIAHTRRAATPPTRAPAGPASPPAGPSASDVCSGWRPRTRRRHSRRSGPTRPPRGAPDCAPAPAPLELLAHLVEHDSTVTVRTARRQPHRHRLLDPIVGGPITTRLGPVGAARSATRPLRVGLLGVGGERRRLSLAFPPRRFQPPPQPLHLRSQPRIVSLETGDPVGVDRDLAAPQPILRLEPRELSTHHNSRTCRHPHTSAHQRQESQPRHPRSSIWYQRYLNTRALSFPSREA